MPKSDRPFLFRQLFEPETSTFTYLVASRRGGEALLLDPVREEVPKYAALLAELDVRLVFAIDTHVHAEHVTALAALRELADCATVMGSESRAECVSRRVVDGEVLRIDGIELRAIHTPGHTDDSYSFRMQDRVFTGDTLIGSTGRTDVAVPANLACGSVACPSSEAERSMVPSADHGLRRLRAPFDLLRVRRLLGEPRDDVRDVRIGGSEAARSRAR